MCACVHSCVCVRVCECMWIKFVCHLLVSGSVMSNAIYCFLIWVLLHQCRCCVQSLGRFSSSPVYNDASIQVLLTYDDGAECDNGRKWRSVITFTCAESRLQVCCYNSLFILLITVTYWTDIVYYTLQILLNQLTTLKQNEFPCSETVCVWKYSNLYTK